MNKNNILKAVALSVTMLFNASCDDDLLDKAPYGVQTDQSFFKTAADLDKALTAAYSFLNEPQYISYESGLWIMGDIGSDDADSGPVSVSADYADISYGRQRPTNSHVNTFWTRSYKAIAACNLVIDKQTMVSGNEEEINKIVNQAKFLRAFYYYNLVAYYGDVPMPVTYVDPGNVNLPRTPAAQVWAQIESDLKAATALPTKSEWGPAQDGRATSGAAWSMLGKAYMFQEKYQDAEDALKNVLEQNDYALLPDYGAVFRKASGDYNNAESIFDIKHKTNVSGGSGGYFNVAEGSFSFLFQQPADRQPSGWAYNAPTQDLLDEYEEGDSRAIYTFIFEGDVFPWDANSTYVVQNALSSTGYQNRKAFIPKSERTATSLSDEGKSVHLIRYAEVLLLYAEALNENGKSAQALPYINQVRERARNTPAADPQRLSSSYDISYTGALLPEVTTVEQAALRNAIWHEQRVELGMESHRREYLIRTGRFKERLEAAKAGSGATNIDENVYKFLPIPQAEIDLSNNVLQQTPGF